MRDRASQLRSSREVEDRGRSVGPRAAERERRAVGDAVTDVPVDTVARFEQVSDLSLDDQPEHVLVLDVERVDHCPPPALYAVAQPGRP